MNDVIIIGGKRGKWTAGASLFAMTHAQIASDNGAERVLWIAFGCG